MVGMVCIVLENSLKGMFLCSCPPRRNMCTGVLTTSVFRSACLSCRRPFILLADPRSSFPLLVTFTKAIPHMTILCYLIFEMLPGSSSRCGHISLQGSATTGALKQCSGPKYDDTRNRYNSMKLATQEELPPYFDMRQILVVKLHFCYIREHACSCTIETPLTLGRRIQAQGRRSLSAPAVDRLPQ
ncbi:hypothetical protein AUEXF2481DRAFT_496996 [Aureobasidium subglaciale EXF-2481]|uniref:Uncharacterized protein n=1 Tax=Aureobasidium subglaciale (strain EXF-2481) TaxID=1043005 RepID=A0A074YR46_AURSE|nr:uncharacterized protein AUEXF2481DRAFT_496996 [Aureobasidium subglaciale EXF-2481]KEQ98609.1 hypothetical protein AUEXF2481DRAFT_496996 [Aureobasidium subglaciale EXF-2481]